METKYYVRLVNLDVLEEKIKELKSLNDQVNQVLYDINNFKGKVEAVEYNGFNPDLTKFESDESGYNPNK